MAQPPARARSQRGLSQDLDNRAEKAVIVPEGRHGMKLIFTSEFASSWDLLDAVAKAHMLQLLTVSVGQAGRA